MQTNHTQELCLVAGVLIPLISFAFLAFFGARLGKPRAGYIALAAIGASCILSLFVLAGWLNMNQAARIAASENAYRYQWATIGSIDITVGVKLDSLTVIMYFMVTFISFWIHFFSIGYMEGHSDEVDHESKYPRFFAYLSLFCFSMLGLVISSSLLFLFIFWELVGLCSYLLIGFYFDRKYASNAAIKAFVTNRVGDFGFILGLALVVMFLKTFDLDQAAAEFARQYRSDSGIFASPIQFLGLSVATLMGIGLFCGAMGKSAQFPLHVWLPDAMAGPTPVSALIHAATMVAAGVYLVARIFRLLTPEAQMFVALIGCITLTITALIAIVQTDIKKVLAYSTLSQLGYMIFGLGVGAWVAALFHLMTHAFFKAMLFLGSGQVIEGCHHEQDIRKMGGLYKKMPVTCWTFFIGVLAIAGFGIPTTHFGLGGFFSKDEILAVAYERAFNLPALKQTDAASDDAGEHALALPRSKDNAPDARLASATDPAHSLFAIQNSLLAQHGPPAVHSDPAHHADHATGSHEKLKIASGLPALPKWMFWLPIIIAYITPFYMMRCWWLTFMGKPRDHHVHDHAHENWKMFVPLVVLAIGTVICSYTIFRPLIHDAATFAANAPAIVAIDGEAHAIEEAGHGAMLTLTHEGDKNPHAALAGIVGFAWIIGIALAIIIYRKGLVLATRIRRLPGIGLIYYALERKLFFDDLYEGILVPGIKGVAIVCGAIDRIIVDGLVDLTALLGRAVGSIAGRQLDMPIQKGDIGLVDAIANGAADFVLELGQQVRRPQNGRIRNYVVCTAGAVAVALLITIFHEEIADGYRWLQQRSVSIAQS